MQYWRPGGPYFVGDCMPFWHEGCWHLYYLLDQEHHRGLGGLGGHQWAHASTRDLIHWEQHPLALAITADWEGSICTGSMVHDGQRYHAFFPTRMRDRTQHLGHAVSEDGLEFVKLEPNPFMSAPEGYGPVDFRDPFVWRDAQGVWQMLVTTRKADYALPERNGCLLQLCSDDLYDWQVVGPALFPAEGPSFVSVPECPDYFQWNGWHYLLFGQGLESHYRVSRSATGPWERRPVATLGNRGVAVLKTAAFGEGVSQRRIGAAWIGSREDDRDDGRLLWGGVTVLRELIQHEDGSLGTRFVPELVPPSGERLALEVKPLTDRAMVSGHRVRLESVQGMAVAGYDGLPQDYRLRCTIKPEGVAARIGLGLRGAGRFEKMADLALHGHTRSATLADQRIESVVGLDAPFSLDVIVRGDMFDVCIDERRCLINRLPEQRGDSLFLYVLNGAATVDDLTVAPLVD